MNKARRKKLRTLAEQLDDIMIELEMLKGEEETYLYNIPENLQGSDRYEAAENNARLIRYENTGLMPNQITEMRFKNAKLRELLECINEDMNDLQLCRTCKKDGTCYHANGRSCVNDKYEYAFADEVAEVLADA